MKRALVFLAVGTAVGLASCGEEGDVTTTVKEGGSRAEAAAQDAQRRVAELERKLREQEEQAQEQPPPAPEPEPEPAESPPDVVGLTLPAAKQMLKEAGYKADVSNTDAAFGILVPSNYTVCEQSEPRGDLVPILAQKEGC